MNDSLRLPGSWVWAFDHLVGYGAAAIAEADGHQVELRWSDEVESVLELRGVGWDDLAEAVHRHAIDHATNSWVQENGLIRNKKTDQIEAKGLFSPRVPAMTESELIEWYHARSSAVDVLVPNWRGLAGAMIGALGAPSYWSWSPDRKREPRPDHGATPWEMITRNQGKEFVGDRLRKLAAVVAARTTAAVRIGLQGSGPIIDEVGKNSADSRTPTGLAPPRATDNARAWCALWGLSVLSLVAQQAGPSHAAGYLRHGRDGVFYLPVMTSWWGLGRLRTVLRSSQLLAVVADRGPADEEDPAVTSASRWLADRGVSMVVQFPAYRSANAKAPERWAGLGASVLLRGVV